MTDQGPRVGDLGEQDLLAFVQGFCPPQVVGDDGAILSPTPGYKLVITTDVLVDGTHFSDRTTPPEAVGWRAVAANLSDLAAMGAMPLGITVGLSLPSHCPVAWLQALYQGMVRCLDHHGSKTNLGILGGDLCRSTVITIGITAIGEAPPPRLLVRHGAQPGDVIVATGLHGASRAGLELLLQGTSPQLVTLPQAPPQAQQWIQAHQYPVPRLDIIPWLDRHLNDLKTRTLAAMDSSDGLGDAIVQICRASGVGARIDRRCLPLPPGLENWVGAPKAWEWTLYGGEDFELVLALPRSLAQDLCDVLKPGAVIIGEVTEGQEIILHDSQGVYPDCTLTLAQGFQHFNPGTQIE
jgi:thiamine-monophosphate kinase